MESYSLSPLAIACVASAILLLEWLSPWRRQPVRFRYRWLTNVGLMLLGGILVSALLHADLLAVAADLPGGRISQWQLPLALEVVLVFLLLDSWRYWEHRVLHEVPLLWRAHLVHHSDTSVDVTTGQRHHPLEAMLTTCTALLLVFALGFSAAALAVYLAVANLSALWTHANLQLPEWIDRPLRRILVTPAVHAIHHSDQQPHTDSNYGSVLTLWDRLFGTYTDPAAARIAHFGLQYFHRPQDTTLASVLLQPFEYSRGLVHPQRAASDRNPPTPALVISSEWRRTLLILGAALALSLLALWPTVVGLAQVWSGSESYQYAWLVIPMFGYLVGWYHRDRILAMTPRADYLGLPVILCAVLAWHAAYVVDIQLGQHLALVLVVQGIALCALGRNVYRQLFPLLAMLFLLLPSGDILQPLLRDLTVKWIEWFALVFNLPLRVDGFTLYIGEHRYVVIDACSGLTFVTLAGFLGYSFGAMLFRSFGKILALAAVGAALGVFTNALRVWLIVGIDWLRGSQMDMSAHMDMQWLALLGGLGLLFYITVRLARRDEQVETTVSQAATQWGAPRFAPVLAGVLVLAVIAPARYLASVAAPTSLPALAGAYPDSSYLEDEGRGGRALLIPFDEKLSMVIAEPQASHGRVDESRLYPAAEGTWHHAATAPYRACVDAQCTGFVHKTWRRKGSEDTLHALYVYYVGDEVMASKLAYRLAGGWNRITGNDAGCGMIGFRIRGELPQEQVLATTFARFRDELRSAQAGAGERRLRPDNSDLAAVSLVPWDD